MIFCCLFHPLKTDKFLSHKKVLIKNKRCITKQKKKKRYCGISPGFTVVSPGDLAAETEKGNNIRKGCRK